MKPEWEKETIAAYIRYYKFFGINYTEKEAEAIMESDRKHM